MRRSRYYLAVAMAVLAIAPFAWGVSAIFDHYLLGYSQYVALVPVPPFLVVRSWLSAAAWDFGVAAAIVTVGYFIAPPGKAPDTEAECS